MIFGIHGLFAPLVALPYVVSMEVMFFRGRRFFVKSSEWVAGLFVVREKTDALYVGTLAVAPDSRRRGIATTIRPCDVGLTLKYDFCHFY